MPCDAPQIPKFCMLLDWGTMNNFFYCADIQISIDVELKFLEQIHNLLDWGTMNNFLNCIMKNLIVLCLMT
jgi:hypothetical protein